MGKKTAKEGYQVTFTEKAAYVLANLGNIPITSIMGSYLLIFYTNVCGMDPAACATLFLIARILDGVNDPFIGYVLDHIPRNKMGHFRPILMVGTILCSLNFLLLWFGPMMAPTGKLAIAYISYLLIGVTFSIMDISLNSLLPVMTTNVEERNTLGTIKGATYMVGSMAVAIAAPLVLGDTSNRQGYIALILGCFAVVFICSIVGAAGVKERVFSTTSEKYTIKDLFKIITMKPMAGTFLCTLLFMVSYSVTNTIATYFYTYILGDLTVLSLVSLVNVGCMLLGTVVNGVLLKRFGKKTVFVLAIMINAVAPLIRLLDITNIPILMVSTVFSSIGMGMFMTIAYGIQADNTDYVEVKTGQRAEGAVSSLSSFVTLCAGGIGGAIPGYLLAMFGFQSTAAVQTDAVNNMIIGCTTVLPAVLSILAAVVFGVIYPLTKEKLAQQNQELAEIRAVK